MTGGGFRGRSYYFPLFLVAFLAGFRVVYDTRDYLGYSDLQSALVQSDETKTETDNAVREAGSAQHAVARVGDSFIWINENSKSGMPGNGMIKFSPNQQNRSEKNPAKPDTAIGQPDISNSIVQVQDDDGKRLCEVVHCRAI